jgi:lambda repressor-like predicted transcriptional regulator
MRLNDDNPIRRARIEAGLDQVALVQRIRSRGAAISLSTLRLAERGECTARTRRLVAAALGVDAGTLHDSRRPEAMR